MENEKCDMTNRILLTVALLSSIGTSIFTENIITRIIAIIVCCGLAHTLYKDINESKHKKEKLKQ